MTQGHFSLCKVLISTFFTHENVAPFTRQRCYAKMKRFPSVLAYRLHQNDENARQNGDF